MKPQYIDAALKDLHISANEWTFSKLVVSVIAGFTLETLHEVRLSVRFSGKSSLHANAVFFIEIATSII